MSHRPKISQLERAKEAAEAKAHEREAEAEALRKRLVEMESKLIRQPSKLELRHQFAAASGSDGRGGPGGAIRMMSSSTDDEGMPIPGSYGRLRRVQTSTLSTGEGKGLLRKTMSKAGHDMMRDIQQY